MVDQSKMRLHDDGTFVYPALWTETRRQHAHILLCFVGTLVLPCQLHALARGERKGVLHIIAVVSNDSVSRNAPALGRNGTIEWTRNGCMIVWDVLSLFPVQPLVSLIGPLVPWRPGDRQEVERELFRQWKPC